MRESERAAASTIRRRLATLSSLYKHLVRHGHAPRDPVREVERPVINRDEGATLAFSRAPARKALTAPPEDRTAELRDRAILSVATQVGSQRAEIAALTVGDLHQNRGDDSVHCVSRANAAAAMIRRALHGYARTGTGSMAAVPAGQAQREAPAHGPGRDAQVC